MVTQIKIRGYDDSILITAHNAEGEHLKMCAVEKDGAYYEMKFGKLTVEIMNNQIISIK